MHHVHVQSSDLWCFLIHILQIQKVLIFEQSDLLFFCLRTILLMVTFFILPNVVFIVLIPMGRVLYQTSVRGASITVSGRLLLNNKKNATGHLSVLLSHILGDSKRGLKFSPVFLAYVYDIYMMYMIYSVFHFYQFLGENDQFLDCDVLLYHSYECENNYSTKLFVWGIKKNYSLQ